LILFAVYRTAEVMHRAGRHGNLQPLPLQPQHNPEPPGLVDGGEIRVPCTSMRVDTAEGLHVIRNGANDEDQYLNSGQTDAFSFISPSEDILLWVNASGTELVVFNVRLQMIIRTHKIKVSPQCVGLILSKRCVLYTTSNGFLLIGSMGDGTFRKIEESCVTMLLNGSPVGLHLGMRPNRSKAMMGRSTYLVDDGKTVLQLLADPACALFYSVKDIIEAATCRIPSNDNFNVSTPAMMIPAHMIGRQQQRQMRNTSNSNCVSTIRHFFLDNLPSTRRPMGPGDVYESAIMRLENRILMGVQPFQGVLENWTWFDIRTGAYRDEPIAPIVAGTSPAVDPGDTYRIRLNPLNPYEIYVHITNYRMMQPDGNRRNELWVMGMSTERETFHWKRRERPPPLESASPAIRNTLMTPMDWTTTASGSTYVRWIDYEAMGQMDHYIYEFRNPNGFILTRVENRVFPLHSLCERVLQGFVQQTFRDPTRRKQLQRYVISHSDRLRAAVTGVLTHVDFVRYLYALFLMDTTHVYYAHEQVYDDSYDLVEHQKRVIAMMSESTPFRSLFNTLFVNRANARPAAVRAAPQPMEEGENEEEEEEG
ncbi:hypothetical protein PFISCL1PPCAC_1551, partial [Pristionchus fissidentatus]